MTERRSYNIASLSQALYRDSATPSIKYDKTSKRSRIEFICHCGQEWEKSCLEIVDRAGALRKVQGYEPLALEELLKTYSEEDIKTDRKDVPRISYKCEDKQRYYFPDIYIPSENKIIEVKSTWTYNCKTDNIELKSDATKAAGYNYEIWIYNNKGNKSIK